MKMNERIRFLAEKAGFVFWGSEEWKPEGTVIDWSCDYSKEFNIFVGLIVNECSEIADKAEPYKTSDLIKQNFGVK
jgi:hypothetical protein